MREYYLFLQHRGDSSLSAEQEEYDPSSSVLFLTICSFAKNTEGFTQFKNTNQIFSLIGTQCHDPLKEKGTISLVFRVGED